MYMQLQPPPKSHAFCTVQLTLNPPLQNVGSITANADFIPISEKAMDKEVVNPTAHYGLNVPRVNSMRLEDFARLAKLPSMSWTEGSLEQREEILRAQLFLEPRDVK